MENIGRLVTLTINDLKSIDVAEIDLSKTGEVVTLTGDNGVGKSTVMEAVEALFNGGKMPKGMIRNGKKEAYVAGVFSEGYRATRRIRKTAKGEQVASLEISGPDGTPLSSPQTVLKNLFSGYLSPSKMANMSGATLYKEIVPSLPVNIDELEKAVDEAKDAEKTASHLLKTVGVPVKPMQPKPDFVSFNENEFFALNEKRMYLRLKMDRLNDVSKKMDDLKYQINQLEEEYASLNATLLESDLVIEKFNEVSKKVDALSKNKDTYFKNKELLRLWEDYEILKLNHSEKEAAFTSARKKKEEVIAAYRNALAKAVGPGGVHVTEDRVVMIGDVPWENAAFSERLKAAAVLQLSSLPENKLPFMFIEHGESMNTNKRIEIANVCIENGATVFMELVNESIDKLMIDSVQVVSKGWDAPRQDLEPEQGGVMSTIAHKPSGISDTKVKPPTEKVTTPTPLPSTTVPLTPVQEPSNYPEDSELDIF